MEIQAASPATYSRAAYIFHWTTAIAFLIQFPVGFAMTQMKAGSAANLLVSLHQSLGFFILWLALLRLFYRIKSQINRNESRLADWHTRATTIAHIAIYALLILVPLTGWMGASAYNSLEVFGLVSLPAIIAPDDARAIWLTWTHGLLAFGLMMLVAVHIGFALQGYLDGEQESDAPEEPAAASSR